MKNSFTTVLFGRRESLILPEQPNIVRSGQWILQIHNFMVKHNSDTNLETHVTLSCNRVTSVASENQETKIVETPLLLVALHKPRNSINRYISFPNHSPKQYLLDSLTFPIAFNIREYFPLQANTEFGIHFSIIRAGS